MTETYDGSLFGEDQPCFGCAVDHPIGFRLSFQRDGDDVVTHFVPSERYQGPPTIMHGGLVATLADEIGAWALVLLLKRFGFTAEMHCKLRQPIRVGQEVEGRGRIVKPGSRVVGVEVELRQGDVLAYTGQLKFALLDEGAAAKLLGGELPEAWKPLAR
ncbi:MAG: PaaI family thioesterase [Deltaproteobacteria bacterium]|nr:PaaI family thioesterase [Deltaproteobacteria bacterium]